MTVNISINKFIFKQTTELWKRKSTLRQVENQDCKRGASLLPTPLPRTSTEEGAEWWVLAIIYNTQDVATLSDWLPDWNLKCEEYKNKLNKQ